MLAKVPLLKAWIADVEAYALGMAVNQGMVFPGFKLVAGRSIRKYADEKAVAQACERAGVDAFEKKLKTITVLEKTAREAAF